MWQIESVQIPQNPTQRSILYGKARMAKRCSLTPSSAIGHGVNLNFMHRIELRPVMPPWRVRAMRKFLRLSWALQPIDVYPRFSLGAQRCSLKLKARETFERPELRQNKRRHHQLIEDHSSSAWVGRLWSAKWEIRRAFKRQTMGQI